jgi:hypothetical protein
MAVYLVAYDILNEGGLHDYEPLWHELKGWGRSRCKMVCGY